MIDFETLSPDAPAIILLCSSIGADRGSSARPLGPRTWAKLSERVGRPGGLVGLTAEAIDRSFGVGADDAERIASLLSRGGQLAFELDRLRSRGIWVVTIADEAYPARLRARLGPDAPPVLFGSGDAAGLGRGGIAIVGSRDADADAVSFTENLAIALAHGGDAVISGGARGIDVTAMRAAFSADGRVIGVLPEGVERRLREGDTRAAVASGHAVLVSPYHPAASFSAGAAMGRNKIIYGLSDAAVVVSSASGSGGTWAGAIEAIRGNWVPVFVRDGDEVPAGNVGLIGEGGIPFPMDVIRADSMSVGDLLAHVPSGRAAVAEDRATYEQERLFDD